MDRAEAVELATKLGIKVHHNAKLETILMQINQQPQAFQNDAMKHVAESPVEPVHVNTPEVVNEAIAAYLAKPGFEAIYREDNTWNFKCRGAEDSGNLSIPLRIIKMKAESVSRGKRALIGEKGDGTYKGHADNIIMV